MTNRQTARMSRGGGLPLAVKNEFISTNLDFQAITSATNGRDVGDNNLTTYNTNKTAFQPNNTPKLQLFHYEHFQPEKK